jgi:N-acetylmuramoyl-L-alanine amidase
MRAWHAGVSYWHGETDINSASIGIEIQNPGHAQGYPEFPEAQMQAVAALSRDIIGRNAIARNVLAHSDIAPGRKIDPGEKFDWKGLADAGVGLWVPPADLDALDEGLPPDSQDEIVAEAQRLLALYGYKVETHGLLDEATQIVLKAFQLHFRQARPDGRLDRSTLKTLSRLVAATTKSPEVIG